MKLFGAEIFQQFLCSNCCTRTQLETVLITYNVQATVSSNTQVFVRFSPKSAHLGFHLVHEGCCT